jgi:hypothetical protein
VARAISGRNVRARRAVKSAGWRSGRTLQVHRAPGTRHQASGTRKRLAPGSWHLAPDQKTNLAPVVLIGDQVVEGRRTGPTGLYLGADLIDLLLRVRAFDCRAWLHAADEHGTAFQSMPHGPIANVHSQAARGD